MQAVRPSQVPDYLHTSGFFLGLNVTDNDEFFIPLKHMKLNTNVDSLPDMTELLNTIRFWGADILPQALVDSAARQLYNEIQAVLEPFRADLPFITTVCSIFAQHANSNIHLELAMGSGNIDAVRYFHKKGTHFSIRAIALAAGKGALDCLQYATSCAHLDHYYHRNEVFFEAVRNGCMDCILFLRQKGFSLQNHVYGGWAHNVDLVTIAASAGQYDVLKYLHSQGSSMHSAAITAADAAADASHFDCLAYALSFGAPLRGESLYERKGSLVQRLARAKLLGFFQLALSRGSKVDTQTALIFARSGNLEYLQLCVEQGTRPSITLISAAAQKGHVTCLQYLHQVCVTQAETLATTINWITYAASIGKSQLLPTQVAQMTAEAQQWECLGFLITHDCPMNKALTTSIVHAGQLELYHLATARGCKVSVQAARQFAMEGNLTLLQHALAHGCERSEEILRAAARHGQLQCLIYARAQGCPWSDQVTLAATRGGHLECLQYLHEHDCP